MKVIVTDVNLTTKSCNLTIDDKHFIAKVVIPSNKGAENDLWVDMRSDAIRNALGAGDHKNWLTIPRTTTRYEGDSEKKPTLPPFVSILNLMDYVSADEYEIARQIFAKATEKLNELKVKAGYKVK